MSVPFRIHVDGPTLNSVHVNVHIPSYAHASSTLYRPLSPLSMMTCCIIDSPTMHVKLAHVTSVIVDFNMYTCAWIISLSTHDMFMYICYYALLLPLPPPTQCTGAVDPCFATLLEVS